MRLICDIETNGLLWEMSKVHCIVLRDIDTGEIYSCADQAGYIPLSEALTKLESAEQVIGHNLINFDLRALKKIYPNFNLRVDCDIVDTLILSRVLWPELEPVDDQKFSHIDKKYKGRHSLAAWGERLGVSKIKFKEETKKDPDVDNVWEKWTPEMQVYCEGDTEVSLALHNYFLTQPLDPKCHELEHNFAKVMAKQEEFGFPFDERAAFALVNTLKARRAEIDDELQQIFPTIVKERFSAKTGKRLKDEVTVFNPGSRQQIADRLRERYPEITFNTTEKGNVKVDDDVLEILGEKYPEAKVLAEYQLLNKRLGQIAEGKEAWLKHCRRYGDGRIHGGVKTNACVSGRCSHVSPNMAQVPSVGHAYGAECRALFTAPEGWVLIGTDASGLELRALGAWLAHFDGGEYANLVSTDGFDIHTYNAKLFGIYDGNGDITKATRDLSKRLIYALLYGAGAKKVGSVIDVTMSEGEQYEVGKKTIDTFYKNLPAIKKLKDKIDQRINERGYLVGIDGRHLQIRSRHSALNQLLQSTGAVIMKKATCIFYDDLIASGLKYFIDFGFCANIHDEYQAATKQEYVELVQKTSIEAIEKSGEYFKMLCPFTGESRVGANWKETH
jgi:DNA polymerase-1